MMKPIHTACSTWYNYRNTNTKPPRSEEVVVSGGVTSAVSGTNTTPFISHQKGIVLMDSISSRLQDGNSSPNYLPGYQLIHEGLMDAYYPTAATPEEAMNIFLSSFYARWAWQIRTGTNFKVYRRIQRPDSVLWDLEYVGAIYWHASNAFTFISEGKEVNK